MFPEPLPLELLQSDLPVVRMTLISAMISATTSGVAVSDVQVLEALHQNLDITVSASM